MRSIFTKAICIGLVACETGHALKATILADTNRDGIVDVVGTTDSVDKKEWTETFGAVLLPNIVDTGKRCSSQITEDTPDADLDRCHDASDNILRNPRFLAPVRTLPLQHLSSCANGTVHITDAVAASNTRIFHKKGDDWDYVDPDYAFTALDLKTGLELGVDARDIRRPGGWDGRATLQLTITSDGVKATDSVILRVAPVLTHTHLQLAQQVLTSIGRNEPVRDAEHIAFVADLSSVVATAGIKAPVFGFPQLDIWPQDYLEPGYASIPGPDGPVTLRIMIRSTQAQRPSGRQLFQYLRSDDVGAVQRLDIGQSRDSFGNLETIPPYTHNGKTWPAGRAIIGSAPWERPYSLEFMEAQETQTPLELDTSWLRVGHVDEFLQFLPFNSTRGWVLMASDPLAGLEIVRRASADGHGAARAFNRPVRPSDPGCILGFSIDELLARENLTEINTVSAKHIEHNLNLIKEATGLTDDEIIRIPALYDTVIYVGMDCDAVDDTLESRSKPDQQPRLDIVEAVSPSHELPQSRLMQRPDMVATSLYPGNINGVVLSRTEVLSSNPWGPVVDGEDIFAAAVTAAYAKADYQVTFMDDWFSHHINGGEIHCGSNTIRSTDGQWW